jgi:hypothetical protein
MGATPIVNRPAAGRIAAAKAEGCYPVSKRRKDILEIAVVYQNAIAEQIKWLDEYHSPYYLGGRYSTKIR